MKRVGRRKVKVQILFGSVPTRDSISLQLSYMEPLHVKAILPYIYPSFLYNLQNYIPQSNFVL